MTFGSDGGPATDANSLLPSYPSLTTNPMRRALTCLVAIVAIGLVGCGTSDPQSTAVDNNERIVGDPAVIARIESSTSCTDLYRERQIAATNAIRVHREGGDASVPLTYQSVASLRLIDLGC